MMASSDDLAWYLGIHVPPSAELEEMLRSVIADLNKEIALAKTVFPDLDVQPFTDDEIEAMVSELRRIDDGDHKLQG